VKFLQGVFRALLVLYFAGALLGGVSIITAMPGLILGVPVMAGLGLCCWELAEDDHWSKLTWTFAVIAVCVFALLFIPIVNMISWTGAGVCQGFDCGPPLPSQAAQESTMIATVIIVGVHAVALGIAGISAHFDS
jgi:hypothetical protein